MPTLLRRALGERAGEHRDEQDHPRDDRLPIARHGEDEDQVADDRQDERADDVPAKPPRPPNRLMPPSPRRRRRRDVSLPMVGEPALTWSSDEGGERREQPESP
jgi:hypothetical protein